MEQLLKQQESSLEQIIILGTHSSKLESEVHRLPSVQDILGETPRQSDMTCLGDK